MLILTEKPSMAKDFAHALDCPFNSQLKMWSDKKGTQIVNCIGHLFKEELPSHYSKDFPVIPDKWDYKFSDDTKLIEQSKIVLNALKENANNEIIIATDADREGEIIARECLLMAGIKDISRIKRFWVSQALTKEVILEGLKNAKNISQYNLLARQGFARQHADWLVGMNFCRYISNTAGTKLTVGRVQTAILSAIDLRCQAIKNFVSKEYYQFKGIFNASLGEPRGTFSSGCEGLYFTEIKDNDKNTEVNSFDNRENEASLKSLIGTPAKLLSSKNEKKVTNPPLLYNLNTLQKDAFKNFEYTADKTLKITQSLYEELKCVSYPRTPSRVMGSSNVELCKNIADDLSKIYQDFSSLRNLMNISISNKLCFNDAKLEAHHALIPLRKLPDNATQEQSNIYYMILGRFFEAFLPSCEWEKQIYILSVSDKKFKITGKKIISSGFNSDNIQDVFKQFKNINEKSKTDEEELQTLQDINWNSLFLVDIKTQEKWTKPPAYFNEASILSFMENPKNLSLDNNSSGCNVAPQKLTGLGTPATRHTFIPKLIKNNYIVLDKKNFLITELGRNLLQAVRNSSIKSVADISATTDWEKRLDENPDEFLEDTKAFVKSAVSQNIEIKVFPKVSSISCPLCKKEVRKGKSSWYCTGYKEGCKFVVWENIAGAKITEKDVILLCQGKRTGIKHCISKAGKNFDCHFILNDKKEIKFDFEK